MVAGLTSCVTGRPPNVEYALAKEALDAAKASDSPRHAPGFYYQAERIYREAAISYENRDYSLAAEQFRQARELAEKAENSARLIRHQTGEVF